MQFKTEQFEHQKRELDFLRQVGSGAIFAEQGTGKTKVSLDYASILFDEKKIDCLFVIAPNGVHTQWILSEIPTHLSVDYDSFLWTSKPKNKDLLSDYISDSAKDKTRLHIIAVNVEVFSTDSYLSVFKNILKDLRCLLILDEATSIKNTTSKRTLNILFELNCAPFRMYGRKKAYQKDYKPFAPYRVILTGTPESKGIGSLFSMMNFCYPNFWNCSEFTYQQRYMFLRKDINTASGKAYYSELKPREIKAIAESSLDDEEIAAHYATTVDSVERIRQGERGIKHFAELREKLAPYTFRITKDECLDLPAKQHIIRYVAMTSEAERIYKQMKKDAFSQYKGKKLDVQTKIALFVRLRQIAGGFFPARYNEFDILEESAICEPIGTPAKASAIATILEEGGINGQVIVVCAFRAEVTYLKEFLSNLGHSVVSVVGGLPARTKNERIEIFKSGKADILIAIENTIAKGYNLQNCSSMIFYSQSLSSEDRMQIEDRIHRNGQTKSCLYIDLLSVDTVDKTVKAIIDGDTQLQRLLMTNGDFSEIEKLL